MKLSEYAIKKPITTIMVTISIVVLGSISLFRLPLEYAPDFNWPAMYINIPYPSSSPHEVERFIARPIEEILGTLSGVKALRSTSYDSRASIRVEFDFSTDMDLKSVQIRDRLDQVRGQLPDDLERIEIRRWSASDLAILTYSLAWIGEDQEEFSSIYKHTILPKLQRLEGVGTVDMRGIDEKVLLVNVDQNRLNAHHLDIRHLNWAIRSGNVNSSAGYVQDADMRLAVRSIGEFEEVNQLQNLPLRNGIKLKDVAKVSYDYPEKKFFERLNGRDAVTIEIRKSSTANLVDTANRVKVELEKIHKQVGPERLQIQIIRDRSLDVTQGIQNLTQSALLGGILAISFIFLFLRSFRSTIIIGSAIPISVMCVFMIMYFIRLFFGSTITLNMVSMMGLMVAIGMLVDPAVVALENIFRKRYDEGQSAWTAAIEGSREIGVPVLAAALTTICVFVPMVFMTDSRSSLWMKDFATTVCISVVASLCIALTLVPLAGSRAFQNSQDHIDRWIKLGLWVSITSVLLYLIYSTGIQESKRLVFGNLNWFLSEIFTLSFGIWITILILLTIFIAIYIHFRKLGLKEFYIRIVSATLHYRWTTIALACTILGLGYYLYGKVEKQRYRWQSSRTVRFNVEMPRSYDVKKAQALFQNVEEILMPRKEELDIQAIGTRFSNRRSNRIYLYLVPADQGKLSTDQVKRKVSTLLPKDIPGVRFKSGGSSWSNSTGVGVEIKGRNPQVLKMLAEDIQLRLQGIKGVHDIETSLESGMEEIQVTVNRQRAQRYGLSPRQVATTVAAALGTRGSSKFKTDEGEINITVQLKEEDRANLDQLKNTVFESDSGNMISFASLADFQFRSGPRTLKREDRMSTVSVFANTDGKARFRAGQEMRQRMQKLALPQGYTWQMDRRFRYLSQEQGDTNFTMIFAAILIYLIMASLFESYIHPFTIMFSICFAFTGVAAGLYFLNISLDTNASYGLLILFGIVVNNGIVLIDHINRYRHQGLVRREAILQGGQDRLRPILMTATTTILGLAPLVIPMVYGTAEGYSRRWGPIGLVVICGLTFSTILTLVILPTIYSLMDDLSGYIKRVYASANAS